MSPARPHHFHLVIGLVVADLDGDGRSDVVLNNAHARPGVVIKSRVN